VLRVMPLLHDTAKIQHDTSPRAANATDNVKTVAGVAPWLRSVRVMLQL